MSYYYKSASAKKKVRKKNRKKKLQFKYLQGKEEKRGGWFELNF